MQPFLPYRFVLCLQRLLPTSLPYRPLPSTPCDSYLACLLPTVHLGNTASHLLPSRRGDKVYNAICVIVNRYTKIALYLPIVKTITITKLVDLFLNKVIRYFRTPREIISNYSSIFTSKFWLELYFTIKIVRFKYYLKQIYSRKFLQRIIIIL